MSPGLYIDIGKMARDLLYRDFHTDQKFAIMTRSENGVTIAASGTKKNNLFSCEIHSQLTKKNVTVDVKANSESNMITIFTIDDLRPHGLRTILSCALPAKGPCMFEVLQFHEFAGITATIVLTANPIFHFSGVLGTGKLAVGSHLCVDSTFGNLSKFELGLGFTGVDLIASLNLYNRRNVRASYYHVLNPLTNTAVGAELIHNFPTNACILTFGAQHSPDPLTTIKARVNNHGKASALIQHQWRPKSFITLTAEVDTMASQNSSKVGFSLLLNS